MKMVRIENMGSFLFRLQMMGKIASSDEDGIDS